MAVAPVSPLANVPSLWRAENAGLVACLCVEALLEGERFTAQSMHELSCV